MYDIIKKVESLTDEQKNFILFRYFLQHDSYDTDILLDNLDEKYINEKEISKMLVLASVAKFYKHSQYGSKNCYKEVLEYYKDILKKCNYLANELKLKNSLEISNLFTYLLWNGYFSKDRQNKYQIEKRNLVLGLYSIDILEGKGVCLNHSDMLCDLLNQCGYESAILINTIDKDMKRSYLPEIERTIVKPTIKTKISNIFISPISKKFGNHAFNVIKEKGKIYIYDSTNLLIYKVNDINTASLISGTGTFKINPYFSYVINHKHSAKKALDAIYSIKNLNSPYDENDFIFYWKKCIDMFKDNSTLIGDYYDDTREDIIHAISELQKIKSRR